MAKRKNARTKATRKATTAARKPASARAAKKASRAKGAAALPRSGCGWTLFHAEQHRSGSAVHDRGRRPGRQRDFRRLSAGFF